MPIIEMSSRTVYLSLAVFTSFGFKLFVIGRSSVQVRPLAPKFTVLYSVSKSFQNSICEARQTQQETLKISLKHEVPK